jgi:hypothetical protein
MEMRIKNTPHARIPPIIGRFVTIAEALPYTATPIRMNATRMYKMFNAVRAFLEHVNPPHIVKA